MSADGLLDVRRLGVLLHPSALPGGHGIGDLGPAARQFVDWLAQAGASVWQILPLCPPGGRLQDVPYSSWSALAGNPQLISLDDLVDAGLVDPERRARLPRPEGPSDPMGVDQQKQSILHDLPDRLRARDPWRDEFARFSATADWARQTARFVAARRRFGGKAWWRWPRAFRDRHAEALAELDADPALDRQLALQFVFEHQWAALRVYAKHRGVSLLGDVPFYVHADSVDVWAHREGWKISSDGATLYGKAGCPPDVFSPEGQFWGMPVFDWAAMEQDDFGWWAQRLARAFEHVDAVRLDHFRAFVAHWEIPERSTKPADGRWVAGPGRTFFATMHRRLGPQNYCVEDLGAIDDDVRALRDGLLAPSMRILHYGFGGEPDDEHLPHNVPHNAVVYPGNHDNDTTVGWWSGLDPRVKTHAQHYLGRHGNDIAWDLNRAALGCAANLAVIQMQDILSLGSEARTNDPMSYVHRSGMDRNWRWRLRDDELGAESARRLRFLANLYGRVR